MRVCVRVCVRVDRYLDIEIYLFQATPCPFPTTHPYTGAAELEWSAARLTPGRRVSISVCTFVPEKARKSKETWDLPCPACARGENSAPDARLELPRAILGICGTRLLSGSRHTPVIYNDLKLLVYEALRYWCMGP